MPTPAAYEPSGKLPHQRGGFGWRYWSVRRARALERIYGVFEAGLVRAGPLLRRVGVARAERPVAAVERLVKGALFDCRMCGDCILSATGMACPMNCPKAMRNGPCGGVRSDGHCEVYPEMPCVWVEAWNGAQRMVGGARINDIQPAIDHRTKGRSSWLAVAAGARG